MDKKIPIKEQEKNILIGNYCDKNFITFEKFYKIKNNYDIVLDIKTFARYLIQDENTTNLLKEDEILEKHSENLNEYPNYNYNLFILIVDKIFFLNLYENLKSKFKYNYTNIIPILNQFFWVEMKNNMNRETSTVFQLLIPGYTEFIDLDKCIDISHFFKYYSDLTRINLSEKLMNFNLYDPYTDKTEFILFIYHNNVNNDKLIIILYHKFSKNIDELVDEKCQNYKYVLLIYHCYILEENVIKSIISYFFKNKDYEEVIADNNEYTLEIKTEFNQILMEENKNNENNCINNNINDNDNINNNDININDKNNNINNFISDNRLIMDNKTFRIKYQYKVDKINSINLNRDFIKDMIK